MKIVVLFLGPARTLTGRDREDLDLHETASLAELSENLFGRYPRLAAARQAVRFAVNQEYSTANTVLHAGDEVAVIPPVSGGRDSEMVEITEGPIRLDALVEHVTDPSCGAVVTFQGDVRAEGGDDALVALEYSAYSQMAVQEMRKIRAVALERFSIRDVAIVHRVGRLEIGETSVAIAVAAGHRVAAFDACRYVIDAIKETVPIWKKDIFVDGRTEWVDPTSERRSARKGL